MSKYSTQRCDIRDDRSRDGAALGDNQSTARCLLSPAFSLSLFAYIPENLPVPFLPHLGWAACSGFQLRRVRVIRDVLPAPTLMGEGGAQEGRRSARVSPHYYGARRYVGRQPTTNACSTFFYSENPVHVHPYSSTRSKMFPGPNIPSDRPETSLPLAPTRVLTLPPQHLFYLGQ